MERTTVKVWSRIAIPKEEHHHDKEQYQVPMVQELCAYDTTQIPLVRELLKYRRRRPTHGILEIDRIR